MYPQFNETGKKGTLHLTDKEFKRLSRFQLIDIIYQFQLQVDKLTERNQVLEQELADKRLRLRNAGNIADAALEINNCFRSAQNAAEQYLNEIQAIREETEAIRAETEAQRQRILSEAQAEAAAIIAEAKKTQRNNDSAIESIIREYGKRYSNNG